jgi:hypothetical protein
LLVLLAAAPEAALAGQWYRCRYSGETRTACCCGDAVHRESGPPRSEVKRASCCDVLRNEPRVVTARAESRSDLCAPMQELGVALAPTLIIDVERRVARAPAERATAPPRPSGPLYIRHSSLLL